MAVQLLVLATAEVNQTILQALYQYVLFDFRIWSKSEFPVRIGKFVTWQAHEWALHCINSIHGEQCWICFLFLEVKISQVWKYESSTYYELSRSTWKCFVKGTSIWSFYLRAIQSVFITRVDCCIVSWLCYQRTLIF